jgi:hypothetical protein
VGHQILIRRREIGIYTCCDDVETGRLLAAIVANDVLPLKAIFV